MRLAKGSIAHIGFPLFRSNHITTTSMANSIQLGESSTAELPSEPIIFCDMDGVLADFDGGIFKITGIRCEDLPMKRIWQAVSRKQDFFETLDWAPGGKLLWENIQHFRPTLLTGVPNNKTAEVGIQKANWCRQKFGCEIHHIDKAAHKPQRHETVNGQTFQEGVINVISCWTRFKHHEVLQPGSILIDDRLKTKTAWEEAGGIFVHHTDTQQTLKVLRELGILRNSD